MAKLHSLGEAQELLDRLAETLVQARGEIPHSEEPSKLPWLTVASSEIEVMRRLLECLNNGGVDLWEAKGLHQQTRSVARMVERQIERYDVY